MKIARDWKKKGILSIKMVWTLNENSENIIFIDKKQPGPLIYRDAGARPGGMRGPGVSPLEKEFEREESFWAFNTPIAPPKGGLADSNWSPPGGSTAAQSFWSREGCDKEGSLEEESLEIWVFLKAFVRILFSALSSAGSWILGFVLGKFLDFLGKVGWRPNQEQRKTSQERAGENMPKVSQEAQKIIKKS